MSSNSEKVKEAIERIDKGLENIATDEEWKKFLSFQSKFYRYSARNTMLIYSQRPDATFIKGYRAWTGLNRYVKKGSRSIGILAPCFRKKKAMADDDAEGEEKRVIGGFRIAHVFDIKDTESFDGNDADLPVLVRGLSGGSASSQGLYETLRRLVEKSCTVEETEGGPKGSYSVETGEIDVRSNMGSIQKVKTLLHEYAHAMDYKRNPGGTLSRNRRELVAESVAYVVCSWLGIDTSEYSFGYLKTWDDGKDTLKTASDAIQKISMEIIATLEGTADGIPSSTRDDAA